MHRSIKRRCQKKRGRKRKEARVPRSEDAGQSPALPGKGAATWRSSGVPASCRRAAQGRGGQRGGSPAPPSPLLGRGRGAVAPTWGLCSFPPSPPAVLSPRGGLASEQARPADGAPPGYWVLRVRHQHQPETHSRCKLVALGPHPRNLKLGWGGVRPGICIAPNPAGRRVPGSAVPRGGSGHASHKTKEGAGRGEGTCQGHTASPRHSWDSEPRVWSLLAPLALQLPGLWPLDTLGVADAGCKEFGRSIPKPARFPQRCRQHGPPVLRAAAPPAPRRAPAAVTAPGGQRGPGGSGGAQRHLLAGRSTATSNAGVSMRGPTDPHFRDSMTRMHVSPSTARGRTCPHVGVWSRGRTRATQPHGLAGSTRGTAFLSH